MEDRIFEIEIETKWWNKHRFIWDSIRIQNEIAKLFEEDPKELSSDNIHNIKSNYVWDSK